MKGFFFIDKEEGVTSFDVVREIRRLTGERKVGHAGTLDPLATGLLIVAVGEGTKLLEYLIGLDKEYEVLAKFGYVSDTYDAQGNCTRVVDGKSVTFKKSQIECVIKENFCGNISQIPPKYSALKIGGKRACDIVRGGGEVEMKSRKVRVDAFDVIDFNWPEVRFIVKCGSGTYIRSLVHDLGQELGCGAYVVELKRTAIGVFSLEDAVKSQESSNKVEQGLISLESIARRMFGAKACLKLSDNEFEGLRDGKILLSKKVERECVNAAFYKEKLAGIVENSTDKSGIKYAKVIL